MLGLIAWLFATTPLDMASDIQVAIVAGAAVLSLLMLIACARLALMRWRLRKQEGQNLTITVRGRTGAPRVSPQVEQGHQ